MNSREQHRPRYWASALAVIGTMIAFSPRVASANNKTFDPGSVIIPMDLAYQDNGMFQAYGLVFQLLRQGIVVYWIIDPDKTWHASDCDDPADLCTWDCRAEGASAKCPYPTASPDFYAEAMVVWDGEHGASRGDPLGVHGYRGGPFVIDSTDAAAAIAIIDIWNNPAQWPANPWANRTVSKVVTAHETINQPFDGYVRKEMVVAPSIAVFADGNEDIATGYIRAAGIKQSNGLEFPAGKCDLGDPFDCGPDSVTGKPDLLTVPAVAGDMGTCENRNADHKNGALFTSDGVPNYCQIMSMHWNVADRNLVECNGGSCPANQASCSGQQITYHGHEVVSEVRMFLKYPTHFFGECQAVNAYENTVPDPAWPKLDDPDRLGHFLTTTGAPTYCDAVSPDCDGNDFLNGQALCVNNQCIPKEAKEQGAGFLLGVQPPSADVQILSPQIPYNQLDGAFGTTGGSEKSYNLSTFLGSEYHNNLDITFITGKFGPGQDDVWMTGYLDGVCDILSENEDAAACQGVGKVSYLGGHNYGTALPLSAKPVSQGARLFLNALFEADCVTSVGQPEIDLYFSGGPQMILVTSLPAQARYTASWANYGISAALDPVLTLGLPVDTSAFATQPEGYVAASDPPQWNTGSIGTDYGLVGDPPNNGGRWADVQFDTEGTHLLQIELRYRVGVSILQAPVAVRSIDIILDTDGDGVGDGDDAAPGDPNACGDTEAGVGDGCDDCASGTFNLFNDGADADGDGYCDIGDPDSDNDGVLDDGDGSSVAGDAPCPDGVTNGCDDNCRLVVNPGQLDLDGDGDGDVCDLDDDGDTVPDTSDNCPLVANPGQENADADPNGDACDDDDDGDGFLDGDDNCPLVANSEQDDNEGDGLGDVCDPDDDNDSVPDTMPDNCPFVANAVQDDLDGDGVGDACDDDIDGDSIDNAADTDPVDGNVCQDVDNDTCDDCAMTAGPPDPANDGSDADNDGTCDVADTCTDFDGDGLGNGTLGNADCSNPTSDSNDTDAFSCGDTDNDGCEDCLGGSWDAANDGPDADNDGVCDAGDTCFDLDGDGLGNGAAGNVGCADLATDTDDGDELVCGDTDADLCDDCQSGSFAPDDDGIDTDLDGECDAGDSDDDDDGVADGNDTAALDPTRCEDTDNDGCDDCAITHGPPDPANDGTDDDDDGICELSDTCVDVDGDGLGNGFRLNAGCLDPANDSDDADRLVCGDLDADGCEDCGSGTWDPGADGVDADDDGTCDATDACTDADGDGLGNGNLGNTACVDLADDSNDTDPFACGDLDSDGCEDCGSGTWDVSADGLDTDGDGECDTGDIDDDDDGVLDGDDSAPLNEHACRDADNDTCDDCSVAGFADPANDGPDADNDGECDLGDSDDDGDGVPDGSDLEPLNRNVCQDLDDDGCDDCALTAGPPDAANDGADADGDGLCDLGDTCTDVDGDGVGNGGLANAGCVVSAIDTNDGSPSICTDSDGDSCDDCVGGAFLPGADGPDADGDGLCDAGDTCTDTDHDGLGNGGGNVGCVDPTTDSNDLNAFVCGDTDADTCEDCSSGSWRPAADGPDIDGDGACDVGDFDADNDTVDDISDLDPMNPRVCVDADLDGCDDCAVTAGPPNAMNDGPDADADGICNQGDPDDDNDGVDDALDPDPVNPNICGDSDGDTCDDCAVTGGPSDPANDGVDFDGDGLCDSGDPDDDNDRINDTADPEPHNDSVCGDLDHDTCDDCSVAGVSWATNDGLDTDADGWCDAGDPDDDNDGVDDGADSAPFDRLRCGDADADTCDDCSVRGVSDVSDDGLDADSDGICDIGDEDDDNDGVIDPLDPDPTDRFNCGDSDRDTCDDCSQNGVVTIADDGPDADNDGACDAGDPDDGNASECGDADDDGCDDCSVAGTYAPANDGADGDGDGICAAGDPNDGDAYVCGDLDADTCDDCDIAGVFSPTNDGSDNDGDGRCDAGDADDDNDGVLDDGDGSGLASDAPCADGVSVGCDDNCPFVANSGQADADDDGLGDICDPDGDDDGIPDDGDTSGVAGDAPCAGGVTTNCDDNCPLTDNVSQADADGDGDGDACDEDDDNDGVPDTDDPDDTDATLCGDVDGDNCDDCAINATFSPLNDGQDSDGDGLCDTGDPDDDNDGVPDGDDPGPLDNSSCGDADGDSCDDCAVASSSAPGNDGDDLDGDGLCDAGDPDDDGDSVDDTVDPDPGNASVCGDEDNDTCDDCATVAYKDVDDDGPDLDSDGLCDAGDPDLDGDGVVNADDPAPADNLACGDSDTDTCDDCSVAGFLAIANDGLDSDGDGICDSGDSDNDNDGVPDANDCAPFDAGKQIFVVNIAGATICVADDDDDDNDGLSDDEEETRGTNARDSDTDDDGLTDGAEVALGTDPLDPDTDDDGEDDGSEVSRGGNPLGEDVILSDGGGGDGDRSHGAVPVGCRCDASGLDPSASGLLLFLIILAFLAVRRHHGVEAS